MDDQSFPLRLDAHISLLQNDMLLLSRPNHRRISCVQHLAMGRFIRYQKLKQQDDLEKSILHSTEAVFLPLPWEECPLNIFQIFFHLIVTLSLRSYDSRQPKDVKWSINCLRYLLDQPPDSEAFKISLDGITRTLAKELKLQTKMEPAATMRDIEEMVARCHQLLKSDISKSLLIAHTMALKLIECLREANGRLPDFHEASIALAHCLYSRFETTPSNDDYEEGMAILNNIIAFPPPRDQSSECLQQAVPLITLFAVGQSLSCGKPEFLEKEISRFQNWLAVASAQDPIRPLIVETLSGFREVRRLHFGVTSRFQDYHSIDPAPVPSFRDLITSFSQSSGSSKVTNDEPPDSVLLTCDLTDKADIEQAIEYYQLVLASYHPSSPIAFLAGWSLGKALRNAFSLTHDIGYLDKSISVYRDLLTSIVHSRPNFALVVSLGSCLHDRFCWLRHKEDLDDALQLFQAGAHHNSANIQDQFHISCIWATVAHRHGHLSISIAYNRAMSLMRDSLTFTPTLDMQHFQLVSMRKYYEVLPLDCASYRIHVGRLHEAIETLEQGRALLWSEMRGLHTSVDRLRAADSCLADKFVAVNEGLERLLLIDNDDDGYDDLEGMDRIGDLLLKQRELLDDRDDLISQVQSLSGFESFLKTPVFDTLTSAASHGPVVIINHSQWRSDIVILHHNSPPSLITTTDDFHRRAIEFRDQLTSCRIEHGLDSNQYERVLCSVLGGLYDLVGRPVIERLHTLNVPEQSRVWWCPTSVFCSLPLHAMGPIPSGDSTKRYFFDMYIPSYTPTLSALIESRKTSEQSFEKPSILLVAQPDETLLSAFPEIWAINQLDVHVTTLMSSKATPSAVMECLQDHRFSHFVCHGKLEYGKPFEASFRLHDGERLTLLDLIRSPLPAAEFAFLSACHTAEMTEGSIADEALHLTAAMQYCGFRSVVGTMWGMADDDGPELVKQFYKSMFSSKRAGTPYYERSARALRDAVRRLRKNRVPLERWVNFVHYGA
ncbi:CHAT domain-containing protein [Russula earlei]|uniref:CHAT domain-containing protein n=1 Tax=Russula earlei TaxID=71964 RepID=A0ACC0UFC0_9AGAM|nr:CHAT domain-containing protein [Russula earlei]